MTSRSKLRFGFIINPFAGIGGKVGLKGSDGEAIRTEAFARGAVQQAENRSRITLEALEVYRKQVEWFTASGAMGANLLSDLGFNHQVVYQANEPSITEDTIAAATAILGKDVDLLIFAGGDGTARNVCQVIGLEVPVLGIPAGVKIHSGVYAVTPLAAAKVLESLIKNELVSVFEASVMDIDEEAFRQGNVRAKKYGEMLIPAEHQYIQSTKVSSAGVNREDERLAQQDIAEYMIEEMDDKFHYLIGSGSSCAAIMEALDLPDTLLGIDWVHQEKLMGTDLTESDILKILEQNPNQVKLIITVIGGQGHIIGRGNQQISSKVLSKLGKENLLVIATKTKLNQLASRPLIVDSDDSEINQLFQGVISIITAYDDRVLYQVGFNLD